MSKKLIVLVVLATVTAIIGLASLSDTNLLRTQVNPGSAGDIQDWQSLSNPGLNASADEFISICPTSSPTSSPTPTSSGEVLGLSFPTITPSVCLRGAEGFPHNEYNYRKPIARKEDPQELAGKNKTIKEILETKCLGRHERLDECLGGSSAVGCVWIEPRDWPLTLQGLVDKVGSRWEFLPGTVIPFGDTTKIFQADKAVYPSAPSEEYEIDLTYKMTYWKLDDEARDKLRKTHSKLDDSINNHTTCIIDHETEHWDIFEKYTPFYFALINNPPVPSSQQSIDKASAAIRNAFIDEWYKYFAEEATEHVTFHSHSEELACEKSSEFIPLDGLDDVSCANISDMIINVVVGVGRRGKGTVTAREVHSGSGTRVINNCSDTFCMKTFFKGATIQLEARPASGYKFIQWVQRDSTDCPVAGDTSPSVQVRDRQTSMSCTAIFTPIEEASPTPWEGSPRPS